MSQSTHILVAEDDTNIRTGLVDTLKSEGYRVTAATHGKEAVDLFQQTNPDLVLLDIMMPEMSGYDVCRAIRKLKSRTPIIMLTAKGEEIDKVVGLELGADDYVTKPFGVRELLARIAAVLRRTDHNNHEPETALPDQFAIGDCMIDRKKYEGVRSSSQFDLTQRELHLLETFFAHPNEVLSRNDLLNQVWGIDYMGTTRTLDQHIAQLRKKVEVDPGNPTWIKTVHGVGYRYVTDAS